MPIINRQDAEEVDQYIRRLFASPSTGRAQALRRLFVEKLDFASVTGVVSLAKAPKNVALPSTAERIATMEGLHVVYVPLNAPGPDRVRKAEAAAAAKLIADELHGDILLVMTNPSCSQLHVIWPTFTSASPSLRRMVIERDLPRRTAVQQLSNIYWQWKDTGSIRMAVDRAFDIDAVTKEFFEEYKRVFDSVMAAVKGFGPGETEEEAKKLFVQTLFNRLMFIYFISRKGWLAFGGDKDYLNALWRAHRERADENKNFYTDRLRLLFFAGLNNPKSQDLTSEPETRRLIGTVPFLNGGLFDSTDEDNRTRVLVPDDCIQEILSKLFDRFNFTVMESTPFDMEVAVDPEMLGKVFEELVTGRHESGSYYTPRPVVSFMCREALKGYLETQNTGASTEAIAAFVDHKDTSKLTLSSAPKIGEALARLKVVDPACGSGAYLLGMMQELVELMTTLYSAQLSHQVQDLYNLKLRIIEQNLYGADIDQFAVNIAMLRLWLSLAIEYDGDVDKLPPLPNLDFKIACGDSLLGPDPSPENYGTLFRHRVHELAGQLATLKGRHMKATGQEKANLTDEVEGLKAQLREALADSAAPEGVVDWRVEFAEVFDQNGGFDVAIANPPYVRQENIGYNKLRLRQLYAEAVTGMSDFYCYFYARALQLLRKNGMHVLVSSNSWLDVGYGAELQEFLLKNSWIRAIYDSAVERQFSTAAINTIISVSQRGDCPASAETHFVYLRDLFGLAIADPNKRKIVVMTKDELFRAGMDKANGKFEGDKWGGKYLRAPDIYHTILTKARGRLVHLSAIAELRRGFTSGANDFFYLDEARIQEWAIEKEFVRPLIKSPRECRRVIVNQEDLEQYVFVCHKTKAELCGSRAFAYIEWAERAPVAIRQGARKGQQVAGFHLLETLKNRERWYDLGSRDYPQLAWIKSIDDTHRQCLIPFEAFVDQRLYEIRCPSPYPLAAVLNSFLTMLFKELEGRVNLGEGVLDTAVYEAQRLLIVNPQFLANQETAVTHLMEKLALRRIAPVGEEAIMSDRKELDDAVFDFLGLTSLEREAVYEGVINLVRGRLEKANTIQS